MEVGRAILKLMFLVYRDNEMGRRIWAFILIDGLLDSLVFRVFLYFGVFGKFLYF